MLSLTPTSIVFNFQLLHMLFTKQDVNVPGETCQIALSLIFCFFSWFEINYHSTDRYDIFGEILAKISLFIVIESWLSIGKITTNICFKSHIYLLFVYSVFYNLKRINVLNFFETTILFILITW